MVYSYCGVLLTGRAGAGGTCCACKMVMGNFMLHTMKTISCIHASTDKVVTLAACGADGMVQRSLF